MKERIWMVIIFIFIAVFITSMFWSHLISERVNCIGSCECNPDLKKEQEIFSEVPRMVLIDICKHHDAGQNGQ